MNSPLPVDDLLAAGALLSVVVGTAALLVWKSARPVMTWALALFGAPIAAALMIDDWRDHAMRVLVSHSAPITAITASGDESLLAIADQNGFIGVTRTDSDRITYTPTGDPARALYFVMQGAEGAAQKSPELLAVNSVGVFEIFDPVSGRLHPLEALESPEVQLQTQSGMPEVSEWTYAASAMNKDGIVAAVRARSRGDMNIENDYEIHFSNRGLAPLPLTLRPTGIVPYEGALLDTVMSDAATQPFLLGFEDGTIGIVWHDTRHSAHLVRANANAGVAAALKPIVKLASSPGSHIASVDSNGTIALWDLGEKGGVPQMRGDFEARPKDLAVSGQTGLFTSIAWSRDGRRIVTASADKTARLWDAATGRPIGEPLKGHTDQVDSAAFSPDGKRIVTASADNTARLWDATTGRPIGEPLRGHIAGVNSAAFSPDGTRIVTASADKTARLWDATTGRPIGEPLKGHTDQVDSAAFSPDGKRIVTASADNTAQLWDATTGRPIGEPLRGHIAGVNSAAFSPDGTRIVTASADKTARLWDATTGRPIGEPLRGHTDQVSSAAFSPDGKRIVTASADNTARVWDAATGQPIGGPLKGDESAVTDAAFSPEGKRVATASLHAARIWDAETGKEIVNLHGETNIIRCQGCTFLSIDEVSNAVDTIDSSGLKTRFDLASGQQIGSDSQRPLPAGELYVSNDNHAQLLSLDDGSVKLTTTGTDLPAHTDLISHVLFLGDGRIVTGAIDGSVRLINPKMYSLLERFDVGPEMAMISNAVSQYFAAETPTGAVLHVLAIGIDHFGDRAGSLHLDYAVDDARDVANALLASQKSAPGERSLYADVSVQYLHDETAGRTNILETMDLMARNMRANGSNQDVAVILFSSQGVLIDGQFYLIPYGFDASSPNAMTTSAVSASEFARKVTALAEHGKVLLLLDACHSGAFGSGGSSTTLDAGVLRNMVNMDNVTVLASSRKDELSLESPAWKHGAFTKAFLDALSGGADPQGRGVISVPELASAMDKGLESLTRGKQHLGANVRFQGDIFLVSNAAKAVSNRTSLGWPETIEALARMRSQAEACVALLKASGDKAAIAAARIPYEVAKAEADGVIAGPTTALVQGGKPDALPTVLTSLKKAGAGLRDVCDAAVKTISAEAGNK